MANLKKFIWTSHREKLINARRTASVLYEVLKTLTCATAPQVLHLFLTCNPLSLLQKLSDSKIHLCSLEIYCVSHTVGYF